MHFEMHSLVPFTANHGSRNGAVRTNVVLNREDSLASSTAEVVQRVRSGDNAFLMGAAAIEYLTDRDCQLAHIGGPLSSKGY
ncbi:hypothetical protein MTO96_042656 [Rhipicephalus appendiculatus]